MNRRYDPQEIERNGSRSGKSADFFEPAKIAGREKYYVLEMFPYPSGKIHMGHVRNYSIGDVVARYKRLRGFNVIHPMGWDAFGMPAENAAIQHGVHPAKWTADNIATMKRQLRRMGFSYEWEREVDTSRPEYYRWEQWLFLKMFEKGLAYQKTSSVNWCERCQTVLANEQVEAGRCWRCDGEVAPKEMPGWFFKITAYTEELLEHCDRLPGWPERVTTMQKNWIGRSEGAMVHFPLWEREDIVPVFTTRHDTLFGATFMTLAPEHPLTLELSRGTPQEGQVQEFVERVRKQDKIKRTADDYEKEGLFIGAYCRNPLTGGKMPIFAGNFVLMEYGTGAVMAVPTHDQRDFYFAKKFNLPLAVVIQPEGKPPLHAETMEEAFCEDGVLVNSGPFSWHGQRPGPGGDRAAPGREGTREENGPLPPARLGDLPAAILGGADSHRFLPGLRDGPRSGEGSPGGSSPGHKAYRQRSFASGRGSGLCEYDLPALRKTGEAGNGYHGHLCGVFLVF